MRNNLAREIVWELLLNETFPSRLLSNRLEQHGASPQDHAFSKELLYGCLRWHYSFQHIASVYSSKKLKTREVQWAVSMGLYQIFAMTSVPPHAAIYETIEAAEFDLKQQKGAVNAILREVLRGIVSSEPQIFDERSFFKPFKVYFSRPVFADKEVSLSQYLAQQYSYSEYLISRWLDRIGEKKTTNRLNIFNRPAITWKRNNVIAVPGSVPYEIFTHQQGLPISDSPGFKEGLWSIQDRTSLESAYIAKVKPGETLIDLCAAPGGKSFAIYEALKGAIKITACDVNFSRLETMKLEGKRLGHDISYQEIGPEGHGVPQKNFDWVVCDVPCSNTGVLHKRPEARLRFNKKFLHQIESTQNVFRKKILPLVVGPQTKILYSTCSLEDEENEIMLGRIAKQFNKRITQSILFEPSKEASGGFAATLEP